jgi:hypothetical protein
MPESPDYVEVFCPKCGAASFMQRACIGTLFNVNHCSACFAWMRLVSLDPAVVETVVYPDETWKL